VAKWGYRVVNHVDINRYNQSVVRLDQFDVIRNSDNKIINPGPLTVKGAEKLVWDLPTPVEEVIEPKEKIMTNQSQELKWLNVSGIFQTRDGRVIQPGETFKACPEDVPEAFRNTISPLEPLPEDRPLEVVEPQYQIISRGPGWFNVVDGNGKVKNEKPLKQADAQALITSLS